MNTTALHTILTHLRGKPVTVVGMGRSALGAVHLLLREGAIPFVSDHGDSPSLRPFKTALDALHVGWECCGHTESRFLDAALIVLSPGVPPAVPLLQQAREHGIPIIAELELGFHFFDAPILAVTGTNGKTTVTELLASMLQRCGHRVGLCGNNDTPLSQAILALPAPDYLVVEVSSYQLESCVAFRPWIGCALNLTPDHLGRHGDMETYAQVKNTLFSRQEIGDTAVLNWDDPAIAAMATPEGVNTIGFSLKKAEKPGVYCEEGTIFNDAAAIASTQDIPLPGKHNRANALAALAMARAGGFDWEQCLEGLRAFQGVEHRIEKVRDYKGALWYNDSKSTNIDSLRVALEAFEQPIVLLAGGQGKGAAYDGLVPLVQQHVKALVAFGDDAAKFEAAFGAIVPTERGADDMKGVVVQAAALCAPGDVVLLSPGCASFDWYANFEERGYDFKRCVLALEEDA